MSTILRSKTIERGSLFYDQFHYQCKYHIKEASVLKKFNHEIIDENISFRNSWTRNRINPDLAQKLHEVCAQFLALKNPFKTMISGNWIYFYTSSLSDIDELATGALGKPLWGELTKVKITHNKNEIGLKNPQFKYRTFIREHRPNPQEIASLKAFIESAAGELRASPGMRDFLKKTNRVWVSNGYFFDHNEMSMATALALINPKLIRKTLPIVQVNS